MRKIMQGQKSLTSSSKFDKVNKIVINHKGKYNVCIYLFEILF
jgi:hypothetical protein